MDGPETGSVPRLLRLLGYAKPYWPLIIITVVFSLVYAGGLTGRAYLIQPLLDGIVLPSAQISSLTEAMEGTKLEATPEQLALQREELEGRVADNWRFIVIAALLIIAVMPVARLIRDYAGEWVMTRVLVDLQADLSTKLLRLPLGRHQQESRGDFVARMLNDTAVANRVQSLVFG